MARDTSPQCKQCRREGEKLFLKGERCLTDKCGIERRAYPPGQNGRGRIRQSEYLLQLREKQKARRFYGVLESQFRRYYERASRQPGITGENLLRLLEMSSQLAARRGEAAVTPSVVIESLGTATAMPLEMLDPRTPLDVEALRARLASRVLGQPAAVECLVERIALVKAGLTDPARPLGVFLFVGPTGTGKTAAFALPLLHTLGPSNDDDRVVRGLVLVPTRELAMQVAEAIHRYGRQMGVRVLPIYGGQAMQQQLRALKRGIDVVVATPGRALDHIRRRTLRLDELEDRHTGAALGFRLHASLRPRRTAGRPSGPSCAGSTAADAAPRGTSPRCGAPAAGPRRPAPRRCASRRAGAPLPRCCG